MSVESHAHQCCWLWKKIADTLFGCGFQKLACAFFFFFLGVYTCKIVSDHLFNQLSDSAETKNPLAEALPYYIHI